MKVAVTGANGRVGKGVVQELLAHQHQVRTITLEPWEIEGTENVVGDIRSYEQIEEALAGCEAVIHLAAIPSPIKGKDAYVFQNNVMGVYHVTLAAGLHGIKRIAIASSDCAIGITFAHQKTEPVYLPTNEQHPATPDNCYGMSKLVGEQIAQGMAKRFNISIASLRISLVVEPEKYNSAHFQKELHHPELNYSSNLWSYIDLRDAARAFRLAVEKDLGGHQIFHITAKNSRSVLPTQDLIQQYYPRAEIRKDYVAYESLQDCSKAEEILQFVPRYQWNDQ